MELQYFGGNCLKITTKKISLVVDDNLDKLGGKNIIKDQDIALFSSDAPAVLPKAKLVISGPGEYEVAGVSVMGIAARGHADEAGQETAVIFKIIADDISVIVTGHIQPDLTDQQLEAIGRVDVLAIPVGGGITLDGAEAAKVIREVEPKIIVPTYFANPKTKYPTDVAELSEALKNLGMEPAETVPKLKLKGGELPETAKLMVLEF